VTLLFILQTFTDLRARALSSTTCGQLRIQVRVLECVSVCVCVCDARIRIVLGGVHIKVISYVDEYTYGDVARFGRHQRRRSYVQRFCRRRRRRNDDSASGAPTHATAKIRSLINFDLYYKKNKKIYDAQTL